MQLRYKVKTTTCTHFAVCSLEIMESLDSTEKTSDSLSSSLSILKSGCAFQRFMPIEGLALQCFFMSTLAKEPQVHNDSDSTVYVGVGMVCDCGVYVEG